jgi:hypothetical protein
VHEDGQTYSSLPLVTNGNAGWENGGFIPSTGTQFYLIKYEQYIPSNTTLLMLCRNVLYFGSSEPSSSILITTFQKHKGIL